MRDRTLLIENTIAFERETKTRRNRTVPIMSPLVQDLGEWRIACGRPVDKMPLFPKFSGGFWADHDWRNWRRRVYQPAARAVGASGRPYDLRHSGVSLWIAEGLNPVEVARRAGHSVQTCLSTYSHLIEEFSPSERVSAEALIRQARQDRKTMADEQKVGAI